MSKKIPCPVCGSGKIGEVSNCNDIAGPGFSEWVEYEYCKNCGVLLSVPFWKSVPG
jgi:hypothetical protein